MKKSKAKIKTVHLVSEDELKVLSKTIKFCIDCIVKGEEDIVLWTLERLEKNINKTLKESKL